MIAECRAALRLTSEVHTGERIHKLLPRIDGGNYWNKGDSIQKTMLRHKESGWQLRTNVFESVQSALCNLMDQIGDRVQELRKVIDQESLDTELSIQILVLEGSIPEIWFKTDQLSWCLKLQAIIDIDVIKGSQ